MNAKEAAKDLSWHPNDELLILLTDGRILRLDGQGKIVQAIKPALERLFSGRVEAPESIYVEPSGEIYVTYPKEGIIARYTSDGNLYGIRRASLWGLSQFAVDGNGRWYGCYGNSSSIFAFDSEGWLTELIGTGRKKNVSLKEISSLAVAPDGSSLVAADPENTSVAYFDLMGSTAPVVFGQPGKNEGQFSTLTDVVTDDYGHVYVLDSKLSRISIFNRNGQYMFSFGQKGKSDKELRRPTLLAVRPGGQTAFVCDGYEIKKFDIDYSKRTATHSASMGGKGKGPGQLLKPAAIACDRQGLLYILDSERQDLQVIDFRGKNAIGIYSHPYEKWGFQSVSEMLLNVDGKPYLIDAGRLVGLTWRE